LTLSLGELLSFLGMVILLVMFPGPNTVLIMQSVGLYGKRTGFGNVLGIASGLYIHALAAVAGLSVIIAQSAGIYRLIQLLGAIYIIYLGIRSFFLKPLSIGEHTGASINNSGDLGANPRSALLMPQMHLFPAFTKGLFSTLFNPKIALFFVAIFPQFIHNQNAVLSTSLFLTLLYSLISATWYSLLVIFVDKFRRVLIRQRIQRIIQYFTGLLLIALGFRIAIQRQ
jgi:threonine/homoserine/homoserine lactone efflux protein